MFNFFKEMEVFNNISYTDSTHSYLINNKNAISGTQLIHKLAAPFNDVEVAQKYAKKNNLDYQDVLNSWSLKNVISTVKGSILHEFIELHYQKRNQEINAKIVEEMVRISLKNKETYKKSESLEKDIIYCTNKILKYRELIIPMIKNFLNEAKGKLIPIGSEIIIGDEDYLVCGTIDQLFYNTTFDSLEIWDWKTNQSIDLSSNPKFKKYMSFPVNHLEDCNFNHYSLQLNLYKFIIEKNTSLKVSNLWLTHFSETLLNKNKESSSEEDDYIVESGNRVIIPCANFQKEIKDILEYNKNKKEIESSKVKGEYI